MKVLKSLATLVYLRNFLGYNEKNEIKKGVNNVNPKNKRFTCGNRRE